MQLWFHSHIHSGYYSQKPTVEYDEDSEPGPEGDFVVKLCKDWETAARLPSPCDEQVRSVVVRTGIHYNCPHNMRNTIIKTVQCGNSTIQCGYYINEAQVLHSARDEFAGQRNSFIWRIISNHYHFNLTLNHWKVRSYLKLILSPIHIHM